MIFLFGRLRFVGGSGIFFFILYLSLHHIKQSVKRFGLGKCDKHAYADYAVGRQIYALVN